MHDTVLFDCAFYDSGHERELQRTSIYPGLKRAAADGVAIPYSEFKSYAIFREQGEDVDYNTFSELQRKLDKFIPAYEEYYEQSGNTIYLRRSGARQQARTHTEMGGIGAALSLTSRLYGLTEADWQRIPETREKDVDFMRSNPRMASTGMSFIQVEAKGHAFDDPTLKNTLSRDALHIAEKKAAQRSGKVPTSEFFGFITSFPTAVTGRPKIWMLDPPVIPMMEDPAKVRLVKRLYFYWKAIGAIAAWTGIAPLINRVYAIARTRSYADLDSEPLLTRRGEAIEPYSAMQQKTIILTLNSFGETMMLADGSFFYYGFDTELPGLLARQNFREITEYRRETVGRVDRVKFTALLRRRNLRSELADSIGDRAIEVSALGTLYATSAGRVFGKVLLDEQELREKLRDRPSSRRNLS